MATREIELQSGCFASAQADEPMFVLLSRDALAPWLVRAWALLCRIQIYAGTKPPTDFSKVDEANALARSMTQWRRANR